jgi:predicted dehydrogenase
VRYVVGDAAHVTARHVVQAGTHVWQGVLELEDGGLAQFELAVSVPASWSEGLVVYGERGNVSLRSHFPFFLSASHVRAFDADRRVWSEPTFGDSDPFKRQLEAFARAIRGDVPVSPSIDDGIAALDLIAAVEQSTKDGRRATVAVAA